MKKLFFRAATIMLLTAALTACSRDYWEEINSTTTAGTQDQQLNAYMSFSFEMPNTDTRATTAADGQDGDNPSFNHVGVWPGQDRINNVTVYVFKGTDDNAKLEKVHVYQQSELTTPYLESGRWMVKPKNAFPISAGLKTVYIVVNAVSSINDHLPHNEGVTTLTEFRPKYETEALTLSSTTTGEGAADVIASETTDPVDFITMTGAAQEITIAPNVSEADATRGPQNSVSMTFRRAVARVLVTSQKDLFLFKGKVPNAVEPTDFTKEDDEAIAVGDLHFVVGQGEKQLFLLQQPRPATDPQGAAFNTPAFGQKMTQTDYKTQVYQTEYQNIGKYYDYASLWYDRNASSSARRGHVVAVRGAVDRDPTTEISNVEHTIGLIDRSAFVLPTLHKFDATREQTGYCKGNTAYVLVRGRIDPKWYIDKDGNALELERNPLATDQDLYYGLETGFFYLNPEQVQDESNYGKAGQKAYLYKNRTVLYFAWINPDNADGPVNSPVIRNNIYHLHINGINKLGANWNPLVPDGVDNPNPFPEGNPLEPKEPRLYPHDPLSLPKKGGGTSGGGGTPEGGGGTPLPPGGSGNDGDTSGKTGGKNDHENPPPSPDKPVEIPKDKPEDDSNVWMSVTVVKSPLRVFSHSFNP